jgi:hypothetical protein
MLIPRSFRYLIPSCALIAAVAVFSLTPSSASTNTSGGTHPCVGCPIPLQSPAAPHLVITLDKYNPSGTGAIYALWRHDPPGDDWVDVPYTISNKGNAVAPAGAATIVKINGVVLAFRAEQALNAGASRDSKIQFRLNNHNVKRVNVQLILYPDNKTTTPVSTFAAVAQILQHFGL